jgi:O-antigen ligase
VIPAVGTLQRYHDGTDLVEGYRGAWIGLLANPNQLAMVMAVTMPWALYAALATRGMKRLLLLGALGLECATVVVTHSRGGALGMAMALTAFALFSKNKGRSILLVLFAALVVGILAPRSFWQRTETIGAYEFDASAMGRIHSWQTGFSAFGEHPFLGIGAGNYVRAWDRYQPRNVKEKAYASHNMWMQVLVELGGLGTIVFASMFLLMLRGLWKARRSEDYGGEARALLASFTALMVCGTTGGYAFNWFFYMALGVAGAVVSGARRAGVEERADGRGLAVA